MSTCGRATEYVSGWHGPLTTQLLEASTQPAHWLGERHRIIGELREQTREQTREQDEERARDAARLRELVPSLVLAVVAPDLRTMRDRLSDLR